ncbi:unnamed protein product [Ambrosiozyma monospora]|uniref:Unnamed protein product n=1 Tax=Ambrosiozyma monospora TaxID=43982 RepID=A0A9W6YZ35_AMBMO|nr:unnamed protein product [Ambrosiozyma monospora]
MRTTDTPSLAQQYIDTTTQLPHNIQKIILAYSLEHANLKENISKFKLLFEQKVIEIPELKIFSRFRWLAVSSPYFSTFVVVYHKFDVFFPMISSCRFVKLVVIDKKYHEEVEWLATQAHEIVIPDLQHMKTDHRWVNKTEYIVSMPRLGHTSVGQFCSVILPRAKFLRYVSVVVSKKGNKSLGFTLIKQLRQIAAHVSKLVIFFHASINNALDVATLQAITNVEVVYESVIFIEHSINDAEIGFLRSNKIKTLTLIGMALNLVSNTSGYNMLPTDLNIDVLLCVQYFTIF